jgi:transcriptional regulator with XRE-family HTH domain
MSTSNYWCKFAESKEYREEFAALEMKRGVSFQIRAMLNNRGWTQEELAEKAGLSQGVVSRAQNPDYGNLTVNTITRVADGFGVVFLGRFVGYSEFIEWLENTDEESINPLSFEDEYRLFLKNAIPKAPRRRERLQRPRRTKAVYIDTKAVYVPSGRPNAGGQQMPLPLPNPRVGQKEDDLELAQAISEQPDDVILVNQYQNAPTKQNASGGL